MSTRRGQESNSSAGEYIAARSRSGKDYAQPLENLEAFRVLRKRFPDPTDLLAVETEPDVLVKLKTTERELLTRLEYFVAGAAIERGGAVGALDNRGTDVRMVVTRSHLQSFQQARTKNPVAVSGADSNLVNHEHSSPDRLRNIDAAGVDEVIHVVRIVRAERDPDNVVIVVSDDNEAWDIELLIDGDAWDRECRWVADLCGQEDVRSLALTIRSTEPESIGHPSNCTGTQVSGLGSTAAALSHGTDTLTTSGGNP